MQSVTVTGAIVPGDTSSATVTYAGSVPGEQIPLTGSQTYNVDLAMMPGTGLQALKVAIDKVDANGAQVAAPVRVNLTPGGYVMVPPGGYVVIAAPQTPGGVTGLQLVSTANAVAHVSAFG